MNKFELDKLSHIELVRLRPGMYVGGTDFFALINYLVCPFNLLLSHKAQKIDVAVDDTGFHIQSDAELTIEQKDGRLIPFEYFTNALGHGFEGPVLTALSEFLIIRTINKGKIWSAEYRQGQRVLFKVHQNDSLSNSTKMRFAPDLSIFSVSHVSKFVFDSYFRRISHLYKGVQFRLTVGASTIEYYSENGILEMFQAFSTPFQLLHEPIHIHASYGVLRLELVFAFHSWRQNWVLPFVNNGRAVEGGTHETGLMAAFEDLSEQITSKKLGNGVIAIMSIIYPDVVWEGCIKREIVDEKLHSIIKDLVVEHSLAWVKNRPDVAKQLAAMQIFQFPELWYD